MILNLEIGEYEGIGASTLLAVHGKELRTVGLYIIRSGHY